MVTSKIYFVLYPEDRVGYYEDMPSSISKTNMIVFESKTKFKSDLLKSLYNIFRFRNDLNAYWYSDYVPQIHLERLNNLSRKSTRPIFYINRVIKDNKMIAGATIRLGDEYHCCKMELNTTKEQDLIPLVLLYKLGLKIYSKYNILFKGELRVGYYIEEEIKGNMFYEVKNVIPEDVGYISDKTMLLLNKYLLDDIKLLAIVDYNID